MSLDESMKRQLKEREQSGTLRSLNVNRCDIDFYSNDYLSLSHFRVDSSSLKESPGSSRLIAGSTEIHHQLESQIANFFGAQSSLLFNSGYTANTGVLSAIPKKDDIILFDELSHASIKDGIRLSLAKGIRFKHNDMSDLKRKLESHSDSRCFVITEGLFSMDGSFGKVKDIDALCKEFKAYLIVDEAHSGGTTGDTGKGLSFTDGVLPFITIYTFGKAFGSHGAAATCSQLTKEYLINFARTFIYTTALPKSVVYRSSKILEVNLIANQVKKLHLVIGLFNEKFKQFEFSSDEQSPIKIFHSSNIDLLKRIEANCLKSGTGIKAIFPPTVPKGKSCIRISLHADHNQEDLDQMFDAFSQVLS